MVYTWGYGSYWQLGTGQTLDAGLPHKVPPKPTMTTLCAEALPCPGNFFVHVCQGTCSGLSLGLAEHVSQPINDTGESQTFQYIQLQA